MIRRFDTFELKSLAPTGKAFLVLMALFAVFQFSALANFTISIDDELVALREDTGQWIREGRWAAYVLETYIITQPIVPYLPMALFGVFSAIGYIFLVKALGWKDLDFLSFAVFPILIAFPIWSFTLAFSGSTPAAGLGVMLNCLMAYLFRRAVAPDAGEATSWRRTAGYVLAGALLGSIAIGFYQSFFPVAVIVIFATILSLALDGGTGRELLRYVLSGAATIVLLILCYLAITKAVLFLTSREVSYVSDYYRPEVLIGQPWHVIQLMLDQMQRVYGGSPSVYGITAVMLPVILVIGATGLVLQAFRSGGAPRALLMVLAVLLLLIIPFGINLLHGGKMPLRSLVAVPLVVCVIVLLGLRHAPVWLMRVGLIAFIPFYLTVLYVLSIFSATRIFAQAHDQLLAGAIGERIGLVAGVPNWSEPMQFDQFGGLPFNTPYPRAPRETLGLSVFEWSGGHPKRLASYLKLLGLANLSVISDEKRPELLDRFILMPPWPAEGSVATIEGTLLVKLSDRPNNMYTRLIETGAADTGKERPEPFFRLSSAPAGTWSPLGKTSAQQNADGIVLSGGDKQIEFTVSAKETLRNCARLDLDAQLKTKHGGVAMVYYKPTDEQEFRDVSLAKAPIRPKQGDANVTLRFVSRMGFADVFRFELAGTRKGVTITDIELTCRLSRR
jgi:hypothetical protein